MSKLREKQNKRRAEILEAAIPIISETSFDDLSVSDICKSIGISIGTFYHYFTKKNDLLSGFLVLIDDDIQENVFPLLILNDEPENLQIETRSEDIDTGGDNLYTEMPDYTNDADVSSF